MKNLVKYYKTEGCVACCDLVRTVYDDLVASGVIVPAQEVPPPTVPMDYSWARVTLSHLCIVVLIHSVEFDLWVSQHY